MPRRATAPSAPQVVYVQAPPPVPAPSAGGSTMRWLVGALLALSVINLILVLYSRSDLKTIASKQSDQLDLLTRRMDTSDERYAQLRGQFQVTSEKLGLTEQELSSRARPGGGYPEEAASGRPATECRHRKESQRRRSE